jgi:hypothetical protein
MHSSTCELERHFRSRPWRRNQSAPEVEYSGEHFRPTARIQIAVASAVGLYLHPDQQIIGCSELFDWRAWGNSPRNIADGGSGVGVVMNSLARQRGSRVEHTNELVVAESTDRKRGRQQYEARTTIAVVRQPLRRAFHQGHTDKPLVPRSHTAGVPRRSSTPGTLHADYVEKEVGTGKWGRKSVWDPKNSVLHIAPAIFCRFWTRV